MAHAPEEEVVFDAGVAVERRRRPLAVLRGLADWSVAALFFAVVSFAALPMGANRDWAWAPIAVMPGRARRPRRLWGGDQQRFRGEPGRA